MTRDKQTELTDEERVGILQLYAYIESQLCGGKREDKVVKELIKLGVDEDSAMVMVSNRQEAIEEYKRTPDGKRQISSTYRKHMISGLLWFSGGVIITLATYASDIGFGLIFFGAIIFGFIDFVRGLLGWLNNK
jgi:hypothetical protein